MGILEALWHVTAEQQPDGGIGRMSNADIADEMFYDGDPDELIDALVQSEWLTEDESVRLYVHDWHEHADLTVHAYLAKRTLLFANGAKPRLSHESFSGQTRSRLEAEYASKYGQNPEVSDPVGQSRTESDVVRKSLTIPEPDPDPEPTREIQEGTKRSPLPPTESALSPPEIVSKVILHLVNRSGRNYSPDGKQNRALLDLVKACPVSERDKLLETAVLVVDFKVAEWLHDAKMRAWLRPETLFGEHWESYSQDAESWHQAGRSDLSQPKPAKPTPPPEPVGRRNPRQNVDYYLRPVPVPVDRHGRPVPSEEDPSWVQTESRPAMFAIIGGERTDIPFDREAWQESEKLRVAS